VGHRCLFENSFERDTKAVGSKKYTLPEQSMVKPIPRDHKGLYACEPFNHGIQQDVLDEDIGGKDKMDKIIVCTFKLRGTEKEIEKVKAQIASLSSLEEVISLYINTKEVENG
jgi:hypothetical protein